MSIVDEPFIFDAHTAETPGIAGFVKVIESACALGAGRLSIELPRSRDRNSVSEWLFAPLGQPTVLIAEMDSKVVRHVFAFVGQQLMQGRLYGGHMRRPIQVNYQRFHSSIFLSNEQFSGFWLRLFLAPI